MQAGYKIVRMIKIETKKKPPERKKERKGADRESVRGIEYLEGNFNY